MRESIFKYHFRCYRIGTIGQSLIWRMCKYVLNLTCKRVSLLIQMHHMEDCQFHVSQPTSIYFFHRVQVTGYWQTRTRNSILQTVIFANLLGNSNFLHLMAKQKTEPFILSLFSVFHPHVCLLLLESQVSNYSFLWFNKVAMNFLTGIQSVGSPI